MQSHGPTVAWGLYQLLQAHSIPDSESLQLCSSRKFNIMLNSVAIITPLNEIQGLVFLGECSAYQYLQIAHSPNPWSGAAMLITIAVSVNSLTNTKYKEDSVHNSN